MRKFTNCLPSLQRHSSVAYLHSSNSNIKSSPFLSSENKRPLFYVHRAAQGTDEWKKSRLYRITCTKIVSILGLSSFQTSQQALAEILGETENKSSEAMEWGVKNEQNAREALQKIVSPQGYYLKSVGLCVSSDYLWLAGSPDDLIEFSSSLSNESNSSMDQETIKQHYPNGKGVAEYKCPASKKLYSKIPEAHALQMAGLMAILNRSWGHYVCWTPNQHKIETVFFDSLNWKDFIFPQLFHFYQSQLVPAMKQRGIDPDKWYAEQQQYFTPFY